MNKKIIPVFITIFVLLLCNTFLFAEEQLAFYGIKFGSTMQEVKKTMESKDWGVDTEEIDDTENIQHLIFKKENGEFAGRSVEFIEFHFSNNALCQATAFFGLSSKGTPVSQIAKSYSEKYGFTKNPNAPSSNKYIDSKGNTFFIHDYLFRVFSTEVYNKVSGRDKKIKDDI